MHHGILQNKHARRRSLAYLRDLEGLMEDLDNPEAAKYMSLSVRGRRVMPNNDSLNLIRDLKETQIPECMDENNIHSYSPWWQVHGLEPEHCQRNANYLKLLSRHFVADVKRITNMGVKNRNNAWRSLDRHVLMLYREVIQHEQFAHDILSHYVDCGSNFPELTSRSPLVVIGKSGSGKSSNIAKLSKDAKSILGKDCICVRRFIQITPTRHSLHSLLVGVCLQISIAYQVDYPADLVNKDIHSLALFFYDLINTVSDLISKAEVTKPLVVLLDSVDLLEESGTNIRNLWWLPHACPPHVHIVVSMTTSDTSNQSGLDEFLLKPFSNKNAMDFAQGICHKMGHVLKDNQKRIFDKVIEDSGELSVLDLTLITEATLSWRSFTDVHDLHLTSVMGEMFDKTICLAEKEFGVNLVTQVCGYVTTAYGGVSETELTDLLIQDDKLVTNYSLSPNIQPLVLIRLRSVDYLQFFPQWFFLCSWISF